MARLLSLRIDFFDIPPDRAEAFHDRAEAFAADLFERLVIDDLIATGLHLAYGSDLNQASTSFLA
jgi:hypothetical protein